MPHPQIARVDALIDPDALEAIVATLDGHGSHALGFSAAGTPPERAMTRWIAGELSAAGLADVVEEQLPVDAWHLRDAWVATADGERCDGASFGGVPPTPAGGIRGRLVVCEGGDPRTLDGVDLRGAVVLYDWQDRMFLPATAALELGSRGAAAIVLACLQGGPMYQEPGALGSNDGLWHLDAPPMVTVRREDARRLIAGAPGELTVMLDAELARGTAANVVGFLPGRRPELAPIVVGGHHDAWFYGSMDDHSGVAATIALARALAGAGVTPERSIAFVSHTAEEFGLADSAYDWCWGAWWQIAVEHREWAETVPFYFNLEGSGTPDPLVADTPHELRRWMRRLLRAGEREGLLPYGWALGKPNAWTEVWPFLAAGVPGVNVSTFHMPFARTKYHTQFDDRTTLDFEHLARLTRWFARVLLDADAEGAAILDHRARAADLRRALRGHRTPRLDAAVDTLAHARGRERFTASGRGLFALDDDVPGYVHEAVAATVTQLEGALAALARDDRRAALKALRAIGWSRNAHYVSAPVHARELARRSDAEPRLAWARQTPPAPVPDLWHELAALRGDAGAREPGPWLTASLEAHLADARAELERRLDQLARVAEGELLPLVEEPLRD